METLTISAEEIYKIERAIHRQELVEAGAYDGRFRNRITKDRKKEKSRRRCRDKSKRNGED